MYTLKWAAKREHERLKLVLTKREIYDALGAVEIATSSCDRFDYTRSFD